MFKFLWTQVSAFLESYWFTSSVIDCYEPEPHTDKDKRRRQLLERIRENNRDNNRENDQQ